MLADLGELAAMHPTLTLVALVHEQTATVYRRALRLNARGVVHSEADDSVLLHVIEDALGGGTYLPAELAHVMAAAPLRLEGEPPEELPDTVREALRLAARGHTKDTVAHQLGMSRKRLGKLLDPYVTRLGAKNWVHAANLAAVAGLLDE